MTLNRECIYYNMGAIYSLFAYNWYGNNQSFLQTRGLFVSLGMTSYEVSKLYHAFRRIDKDRSGTIQLLELLNHLDIERTSFSEKVFGMFDIDDSGAIDFAEFAVGLWVYCTLDRDELALFTFDLYDKLNGGLMLSRDLIYMLQELHSDNLPSNKQACKLYRKLEIRRFSCQRDAFVSFSKNNPVLLLPAYQLQLRIISKCLGFRFWSNASLSHREMATDKKVILSIRQIRHIMTHRKCPKATRKIVECSARLAPLLSVNACKSVKLANVLIYTDDRPRVFPVGNSHEQFTSGRPASSITVDTSYSTDVAMKQFLSEERLRRKQDVPSSRHCQIKKGASFPDATGKLTLRDKIQHLRHVHAHPFGNVVTTETEFEFTASSQSMLERYSR